MMGRQHHITHYENLANLDRVSGMQFRSSASAEAAGRPAAPPAPSRRSRLTPMARPPPPAARPHPAAEDPSWRRIALVVGALFVVQLAMALLPFGLGAIAPLLRDRFDLTRGEVGLATTAVFVSVAVLSIPMGHLADRAGVAASLTLAAALVALGMAGMAAVDRYGMFLGVLAAGGAGYAAVTPATNRVVDAVPTRGAGAPWA
jgi:sugar phosphate permease